LLCFLLQYIVKDVQQVVGQQEVNLIELVVVVEYLPEEREEVS